MFRAIKGFLRNKIADQHLREAERFLLMVEGLNGVQRASLALAVYFVRYFELSDNGRDFMHPTFVVRNEPGIMLEYSLNIRQKQLETANEDPIYPSLDGLILSGYIVWLLSLRSIETLETRKTVKALWNQISRSFQKDQDMNDAWNIYGRIATRGMKLEDAFMVPEEYQSDT
jgi:hypothetical protein